MSISVILSGKPCPSCEGNVAPRISREYQQAEIQVTLSSTPCGWGASRSFSSQHWPHHQGSEKEKQLRPIQSLPCARHYPKHCNDSFKPHSNLRQELLVSPLYSLRDCRTERSSNLPEVTQPLSNRTKIKIQVVCLIPG